MTRPHCSLCRGPCALPPPVEPRPVVTLGAVVVVAVCLVPVLVVLALLLARAASFDLGVVP